ncbi:MAG: hypothetical protein AAB779_03750, partial [Patescibacteria group bacterium]
TSGVLGLLAYLALLFFAGRQALAKSAWLAGLLGAYFVQNLWAFDTLNSYLIFFVFLAFLDKRESANNESPPAGGTNLRILKTAPVGVGLGLAVFLVFYFSNWPIIFSDYLQYRAGRYLSAGLIKEADKSFEALLKINSPYSTAARKDIALNWLYLLRSDLVDDSEKPDLAKRAAGELEAAAAAAPLNYAYYVALADSVTDIYPYDHSFLIKAEEAISKARQLSPRRQAPLYVLFKIRQLQDDWLGGIRAVEEAINFDPEVGDPYLLYGITLIENGFLKEGKEALAEAKRLGREPKNFKEYRALVIVLAKAGEKDLALIYLEKALEYRPADAQLQQLKKELTDQ